jgi:putative transposase
MKATGLSERGACGALGASRASLQRWAAVRAVPGPSDEGVAPQAKAVGSAIACVQPNALSKDERQSILDVSNDDRFCNRAPATIYATMLDEGRYLGSISTIYRVLAANQQVRERRAVASHPPRVRPELLTEAPNTLWSWDVTKLPGPQKWTWYSLYLILDVFSRYITGWCVANTESARIAGDLFEESATRFGVRPGQLHVHADGGGPMKSQSLALKFADLGISKSHSRPHVSNDNPYSEANFKTLKFCPIFPDRFPSLEAARWFIGTEFVPWYNEEHRHSGIAYLTPADVHFGRSAAILAKRNALLEQARAIRPDRFRHRIPAQFALGSTVYINKPREKELALVPATH